MMNLVRRNSAPQSDQLLAWYDQHRRAMPWRSLPGQIADPYHVWLSEIMLQQTTVATVEAYFEKFLKRWPTFVDFAASDLEDVLKMWVGLGYYARARNLHKCAGIIIGDFGGKFPRTQKQLMQLPGIGPYTAAAIMAIAFDQRAVVVDGNVERVMARVFAVHEALPHSKPLLKSFADQLTPDQRPGDYAQAVMDLGATVCKPRNPLCSTCPWHSCCCARKQGIEDQLPRKIKKPPKPVRRGTAFWLQRQDRKILLRKRPPKGLLGAMMEIPSTPWINLKEAGDTTSEPHNHAPIDIEWQKDKCPIVRHTFTHFHLEIEVWQARTTNNPKLRETANPDQCRWVDIDDLDDQALPTLMRKIVAAALHGV